MRGEERGERRSILLSEGFHFLPSSFMFKSRHDDDGKAGGGRSSLLLLLLMLLKQAQRHSESEREREKERRREKEREGESEKGRLGTKALTHARSRYTFVHSYEGTHTRHAETRAHVHQIRRKR